MSMHGRRRARGARSGDPAARFAHGVVLLVLVLGCAQDKASELGEATEADPSGSAAAECASLAQQECAGAEACRWVDVYTPVYPCPDEVPPSEPRCLGVEVVTPPESDLCVGSDGVRVDIAIALSSDGKSFAPGPQVASVEVGRMYPGWLSCFGLLIDTEVWQCECLCTHLQR